MKPMHGCTIFQAEQYPKSCAMSVGCGEESIFRRNRGSTQDVEVNIPGVQDTGERP